MPDQFPIMRPQVHTREQIARVHAANVEVRDSIPWEMIWPHGRQALINHDQTLNRLAERGGLSACEAVCILEDRRWANMPIEQAYRRLNELVRTFTPQANVNQ